jgi:hypothetical protein
VSQASKPSEVAVLDRVLEAPLPAVARALCLPSVLQVRDAIDALREMGLVAASVLVQRAADVAESDGDGSGRLAALLDLSDDFIRLYEWYDEACSACIEALHTELVRLGE